jgi:opine dehydrogenase
LSLTLTPSNQIIHPGRIYGFFKDWDGKTPYKNLPLFYEDMNEFSAKQLSLLDKEI